MARRSTNWFFTLDLRSLGLFRIFLGVLLLHDASVRWGHLEAMYTGRGVLPAGTLPPGFAVAPSLLHFIDSTLAVRLFFVAAILVFAALAVGWRTRLASVVALILYASIRNRNVFVSQGGDSTLMVLLVWAVFLPLGARFSFDARRAPAPPAERTTPSLAALALPLQMGLIYLTTAIAKSGPTWRDGTAVYYALELDAFTLPLGIALRALPLVLMKWLTWGTLGLEYAALPMLFSPWGQPWLRRAALALLAAMHLGHAATLSIGGFPWAMLCGLTVFLAERDWAYIAAHAAALPWARRAVPTSPGATAVPALRRRILHRSADLAVAFLLAAMLLDAWQRRIVPLYHLPALPNPRAARAVVSALDLRTGWPMFAPDPLVADGWWVVKGITSANTTYDPLARGPVNEARPPRLGSRYDVYWRAYLLCMSLPANDPLRAACGRYFVRRAAADEKTLQRLDFIYVQECTPPPGTPRPFPTRTIRLWEYDAQSDRARGPTPGGMRRQ